MDKQEFISKWVKGNSRVVLRYPRLKDFNEIENDLELVIKQEIDKEFNRRDCE